MGDETMHPEAAVQLAGLAEARAKIEGLAAGLGDEAFNWRPAEGRWSLAENVGHLNAVARLYLAKLPAAIDEALEAGPRGASGAGRGWLGGALVWAMEPPVRFRVPAPKAMLPSPVLPAAGTLREFREIHERMAETIRRAGPLDLGRVRMRLPTIRRLNLPLAAIFAASVAHMRRHAWQMENVRAEPGFPG